MSRVDLIDIRSKNEFRAMHIPGARSFPLAELSPIEFFTQGEHFFDSAIHAGDFFYSWSELSYAPASWWKVGTVVDRTKAFGSNFDTRRGPLVGFKYKKVDLTTYWLSLCTREAMFIFAVTVNF